MKETELLFDLLKKGVSPVQAVRACKERLESAGFLELPYDEPWKLQKNGRYYVNHHDTTLFAFTVGEGWQETKTPQIRMAAAHTDFPCLRIKPSADVTACRLRAGECGSIRGRDLKYLAGSSARYCRPCGSAHTGRVCPEDCGVCIGKKSSDHSESGDPHEPRGQQGCGTEPPDGYAAGLCVAAGGGEKKRIISLRFWQTSCLWKRLTFWILN